MIENRTKRTARDGSLLWSDTSHTRHFTASTKWTVE